MIKSESRNKDMASIISLWYDKEGDFLEITFRDAKGYFQEIDDDIYERVDENGNLLGYAVFNMSQHERQSLMIPLKTQQMQSLMQEV